MPSSRCCVLRYTVCLVMLAVQALPVYGQQDPKVKEALPAIVALVSLDANKKPVGTGSGTVISANGLILTNYHVIGDVARRKLYHPDGLVMVFLVARSDEPARFAAHAKVVQASPHTDLALLSIVTDARQQPVSSRLNLPSTPLGDSDMMEIGDKITLLGFPDIGNNQNANDINDHFFVTLTPATISGFQRDGRFRSWIRTTDPISAGNSGGAAIDTRGCLVGVPSAGLSRTENLEKMGLIRPINYVPASWLAGVGSTMRSCQNTSRKSSVDDPPSEPARTAPAACTNCGAVFSGRIVDANTGRGIKGAIFAIVTTAWRPGTEISERDVLAGAEADERGFFTTDPAIKKGYKYRVLIAATGYKPIVEDFPVGHDLPDHAEFPDPIKLQK